MKVKGVWVVLVIVGLWGAGVSGDECLEEARLKFRMEDVEAVVEAVPQSSVDRSWEEGFVEVYVPCWAMDNVSDLRFEILDNQGPREALAMHERLLRSPRQANTVDFSDYHPYRSLTAFMQKMAQDYPLLARLDSIGKSTGGRKLWYMDMSKGINSATPAGAKKPQKPEVKYVGNMHGDEAIGRENCLRFIHHLLSNYGKDADVTRLLDETVVTVLPSMNPDGFERGKRVNANGMDLNRNFPDTLYPGENLTPLQQETRLMMNWAKSRKFTLSINFHGGAVVACYGYDGNGYQYARANNAPDVDLLIRLTSIYAKTNKPMYNGRFRHGITNAAAWYPLYGGMQDWMYLNTNQIETVVELSGPKWPDRKYLDTYWRDNKASMMNYLLQIFTGVWGVVTKDGLPCVGAKVYYDDVTRFITVEPDTGYFYRMLVAGSHKITVHCGTDVDRRSITVVDGTPVRQTYSF